MKAYVLHDVNDLRLEEVTVPVLADDRVLLEVKAAGICGSDIPRIYVNGTYHFPTIPGHEFSGKVVQVGKNVDSRWLNKRVGLFPLIPCKECGPCRKKQYEMCKSYSYLGSREDGGYAEYVTVPAENLVELPETVSYEAAAMMEPMAVAVHAMRRMDVRPNESVVICGLGTIGLLLLMFLKEAGISDILVVGNKDFQKKTVLELGISEDCYCDSRKQDVEQWILEKTNGAGADVFFECVGKNETVVLAVNSTIPGGKVMLLGNPHSDMYLKQNVYWKILRNQLTLKGTWNSSFIGEEDDDWRYVLEKIAEGKVKPEALITHKLDFEELEKGLMIMRDKTEDYVKVMICNYSAEG